MGGGYGEPHARKLIKNTVQKNRRRRTQREVEANASRESEKHA